jgi:hypothetical protein
MQLFSVRRRGFSDTQRVINRLIRGTVETGVVTATCALTELILFQVSPKTNLHIFLYVPFLHSGMLKIS